MCPSLSPGSSVRRGSQSNAVFRAATLGAVGFLLQVVVSGLAAGAVYGLIGLGYSLVYRMSRVLNFAQGDMVTVTVFAFLLALGGGAAVSIAGPRTTALAALLAAAVAVAAA